MTLSTTRLLLHFSFYVHTVPDLKHVIRSVVFKSYQNLISLYDKTKDTTLQYINQPGDQEQERKILYNVKFSNWTTLAMEIKLWTLRPLKIRWNYSAEKFTLKSYLRKTSVNRKENNLFSLPWRFFTFEWNLLTFSLRSGIVLLSLRIFPQIEYDLSVGFGQNQF